MAKLLVHLDDGISTFAIDDDSTLIGRDTRCHIHLAHRSVSPMHCRVLRTGPDYAIEQLDPDTFTLLNGQVVVDGALHDGDRIELGKYVIQFKDDADFSRDATFFQFSEEDRLHSIAQGSSGPPPNPSSAPPGPSREGPPIDSASHAPSPSAAAPEAASGDVSLPPSDPAATWRYVRDGRPMGPTTLEVLVREIDEGRLSPESLIRGPTHPGPFAPAKEVRGVSRFFGVCHACGAKITEKHVFCHICGQNVTERNLARPPQSAPSRKRRLLIAAATAALLLLALVLLLALLYRSDLWRTVAPQSVQDKIDNTVDAARRTGARIVGPENVLFYRDMLARADRLSQQSDCAQAAAIYDQIESGFAPSYFAAAARRHRRTLLATRYRRARDAAAQNDFAAALDIIQPATQDPLFLSLYPHAQQHIEDWRQKVSHETHEPHENP